MNKELYKLLSAMCSTDMTESQIKSYFHGNENIKFIHAYQSKYIEQKYDKYGSGLDCYSITKNSLQYIDEYKSQHSSNVLSVAALIISCISAISAVILGIINLFY